MHDHPQEARHSPHLGPGRQECRGRRGRSLVGVRRPHVKRHCRDFESQPDQEKPETEQEPGTISSLTLHVERNVGEVCRAGKPKDPGNAVEENPGSKCAQQEILERAFRSTKAIAFDGHEHVDWNRRQFDTEIERNQVAGRAEQEHADRGEQNERRQFSEWNVSRLGKRQHNTKRGNCDE